MQRTYAITSTTAPSSFFFFNDTATTEIYTLSLHDALPISEEIQVRAPLEATFAALLEQLGPFNETAEDRPMPMKLEAWPGDRKSTRLNSSHGYISYAVFCLKKKKNNSVPAHHERTQHPLTD